MQSSDTPRLKSWAEAVKRYNHEITGQACWSTVIQSYNMQSMTTKWSNVYSPGLQTRGLGRPTRRFGGIFANTVPNF
jgi:hypothetical protein